MSLFLILYRVSWSSKVQQKRFWKECCQSFHDTACYFGRGAGSCQTQRRFVRCEYKYSCFSIVFSFIKNAIISINFGWQVKKESASCLLYSSQICAKTKAKSVHCVRVIYTWFIYGLHLINIIFTVAIGDYYSSPRFIRVWPLLWSVLFWSAYLSKQPCTSV